MFLGRKTNVRQKKQAKKEAYPVKEKRKVNLRLLVAILFFLVIAVSAMIFFFSSQTAAASKSLSQRTAQFIIRIFYRNYADMSAREKNQLLLLWYNLVRKLAHGIEFMLLGLFLSLALHGLSVKKAPLITWISGTLYGVLDELHQMTVDGRGPMWQDVCIDSGGVLVGILLGWVLLRLFHLFFPKREDDSPPPDPDAK